MIRSTTNALLIAGAFLVLAGCETTNKLDADFGQAYRNMVASQIYDPAAAQRPPANPPMTMDGQRGSEVIGAYRAGGDRKAAAQPPMSSQLGR